MAISWSYIGSDFCLLWKKQSYPMFSFCVLFVVCIAFLSLKRHNWCNFFSFTSTRLSAGLSGRLSAVLYARHGYPVIWCFSIWRTSSLSYPMAIFSANEIQTFFIRYSEYSGHVYEKKNSPSDFRKEFKSQKILYNYDF